MAVEPGFVPQKPDQTARKRQAKRCVGTVDELQSDVRALQHLPETARILLTSGLLPAAFLAIVLNLVLPEEAGEDAGA